VDYVFGTTDAFVSISSCNYYLAFLEMAHFPGFGLKLSRISVKTFQQAQTEGAMFTMGRLESLEQDGNGFSGTDVNGIRYSAPCAIVASGRVPRRLPVTHSEMKGVNFCSVCDGPLFRGENATLAVVGSDNAAAQHALTLDEETISVDGVFLAIGWSPNTAMIKPFVETIDGGYLKTDGKLMTSIPGMFAAGYVRDTDLYQVLTGCTDGARCALYASEFIKRSLP